MKICGKCKKEKTCSEFYKRAASKDGLPASCKECQRAYDKARLRDPKRMQMRLDYQKSEIGKKAHAKASKKWLDKNKIKRMAHVLVGNRTRSGKIKKKPCEVCGKQKVVAHHDDYAKPLWVRWLCDIHHKEWHAENGEGRNAS